jgi:hypothetical protein
VQPVQPVTCLCMLCRLPPELHLQVCVFLDMDCLFQLRVVNRAMSAPAFIHQTQAQCVEQLVSNLYACESLTDVWRQLRRFSCMGFRPDVRHEPMLRVDPHLMWFVPGLPAMDRYRLIMATVCQQARTLAITSGSTRDQLDQAFQQWVQWSQSRLADCYFPGHLQLHFETCKRCMYKITSDSVCRRRASDRDAVLCRFCAFTAEARDPL